MGYLDRRVPPPPGPELRAGRAPLVFDLSAVDPPLTGAPAAPEVYFLVTSEPDPADRPPWVAAVGISSVVVAGLSLGLLLARILL
jgi:hypothetical protein